jgi:hypothetical protein
LLGSFGFFVHGDWKCGGGGGKLCGL